MKSDYYSALNGKFLTIDVIYRVDFFLVDYSQRVLKKCHRNEFFLEVKYDNVFFLISLKFSSKW